MCGGRDGPLTADLRSRGLRRPGPGSDGGELERPHQFIHCVNPQTEFGQLFVSQHPFCDCGEIERRHPSPSATPIATRVAEVQMRVYPQDEIESHHQELQQSVFELWELSARTRTLWLFPIAPWPTVAPPRASATVPEMMGQRNTPWEWSLLQGSCPPPEKALSGHWKRQSHRWPPTLGVALWESTLVGVGISISRNPEKGE